MHGEQRITPPEQSPHLKRAGRVKQSGHNSDPPSASPKPSRRTNSSRTTGRCVIQCSILVWKRELAQRVRLVIHTYAVILLDCPYAFLALRTLCIDGLEGGLGICDIPSILQDISLFVSSRSLACRWFFEWGLAVVLVSLPCPSNVPLFRSCQIPNAYIFRSHRVLGGWVETCLRVCRVPFFFFASGLGATRLTFEHDQEGGESRGADGIDGGGKSSEKAMMVGTGDRMRVKRSSARGSARTT